MTTTANTPIITGMTGNPPSSLSESVGATTGAEDDSEDSGTSASELSDTGSLDSGRELEDSATLLLEAGMLEEEAGALEEAGGGATEEEEGATELEAGTLEELLTAPPAESALLLMT